MTTVLALLLTGHLRAWGDGVKHVALSETFDTNNGTGGRDEGFSGSIASSNPLYDQEGWIGTRSDHSVYGASKCIRIGTSSANGSCTSPELILIGTGKTATLTFNAAGWGGYGTNKLTITANDGVTLSGDTQITLVNGAWTAYTVNITLTTAQSVQLTFTGKRGFLDDVKVEETVTAISDPTLTEEHLFWPNTTETATKHITLVPADSTTVYYTTDGTEPSALNGTMATLTSSIRITGTTTVKARAYYESIASSVVSKTYSVGSTVNGIAAFNALADGTEARLFLADADQARVLHGYQREMYLRDESATLCVDFGETTAALNPTPQHNQHVAGWIVGRKQTVDGLTKLVATENTTTNYLALAAPVTEAATEPTVVNDIADINSHKGDWVTVSEAKVGNDISVNNRFQTDHYTDAYEGALTDLSGIVTANGQLAPIYYNNILPVVYVIDENKDFVSPDADIANATVRLKRTLSSSYWNTLAVPFDIASLEGDIRELSDQNGNTLVFAAADGITAGKPYLVKPSATIKNPTFHDVTLTATEAQSISLGGYSLVAIYSPTTLAADQTEFFMKSDGRLYYPESDGVARLKGMRAYFKTTNGQAAPLLSLDGETTGINEVQYSGFKVQGSEAFYNLNGQRVTHPTKGLYIVNGKKIIIK